jgi:8-oxo-dGTP diphosphatase
MELSPRCQNPSVEHDCVMAILRRDDRVLMCHRHPNREWIPNVWDFPGGHIEESETPQQALARELREELGVDIESLGRAADVVLEFDDESLQLAVWILDYGGTVENRCPEEHDELRWVNLQDVGELELADRCYISLIGQALPG